MLNSVVDRLGLIVEPSKVRLQPAVEDGYAWSVTASHASLLKTCLSSGGLRFFQTICKELGRSLEAVTPETLQNGLSQAAETPKNVGSVTFAREDVCMADRVKGYLGASQQRGGFVHSEDPRTGGHQLRASPRVRSGEHAPRIGSGRGSYSPGQKRHA